jgi:hypothetical protein
LVLRRRLSPLRFGFMQFHLIPRILRIAEIPPCRVPKSTSPPPKYLSKCAMRPYHSLADVLVSFPRVASVASAGAGFQRFLFEREGLLRLLEVPARLVVLKFTMGATRAFSDVATTVASNYGNNQQPSQSQSPVSPRSLPYEVSRAMTTILIRYRRGPTTHLFGTRSSTNVGLGSWAAPATRS